MARLVVVGGGTAGLAAAVAASELGVPTTLLEKTSQLGGMLHWSSGHFSAAGTRRQARLGIEDHPDLHYADVVRMGHGRGDRQLIRLAVDQAPAMVDWLEGLGFPFDDATPAIVKGHEVYSRPRTYWGGDDPTTGGLPILHTLLRHLDRDVVEIRTNTSVERLLIEDSQIVSVDVVDNGVQDVLQADNVVLATGGYAANRSLVARYQPSYPNALTGCMDHATGDGHRQLSEHGIAMTHTDTYIPTMGMIEDPKRPGFGLPLHHVRVIVDPFQRQPWELWVNRHGCRFVAEDADSPYEREQALLRQPGLEMFVIWDQAVVEQAAPPVGPNWRWAELLDVGGAEGWLFRGDRLDDLADKLDIDEENLITELGNYASSEVDRFGRTHRPIGIEAPPFYAVRVRGGMLLSRGGPAVDDFLRPLDHDGRAIRGLHAVGELLGMGKFSGDSFAGGMSVGPALSLGRWVVHQIAGAVSR